MSKKYEIDYTNFDPDKEYEVKNNQVKRSHAQIIADETRRNFMKEAHKDPERKKIAQEGGMIGIQAAHKWAEENPEEALAMRQANAIKTAEYTMENKIGIFEDNPEQKSEWASLGGSANTEKQIAARKKQQVEHFRPAGTKAAAKKKIAKYKKIAKEFYDLCPDGWFHINDVKHLKHSTSAKSIHVRNTLNRYPELFTHEFQARDKCRKQMWKKI